MFGMPDQMLIQIVKIFDRGIEPPCAIEEVVSGFMHQFRDIHTAFEEGDLFGGGNYSRVLKRRSEEHTSELQSLMRISYAVFCLKKKKHIVYHYNVAKILKTSS